MRKLKLVGSLLVISALIAGISLRGVSATVPGINDMESVDTSGNKGNNTNHNVAISGDGKYTAFESSASNLVANDTNSSRDIFVRDNANNTTTRVSVSSSGTEGNSDSIEPAISYSGRYVVYASYASNLVSGDTNGRYDIFLYDMQTGATTLISKTTSGTLGNQSSTYPDISADGRYIAFNSFATNLDSSISTWSGYQQVFVVDTTNGILKTVSVNASGSVGNWNSNAPSMSCDGGIIAFDTGATNLFNNDTNGYTDIIIANRVNGSTDLSSITSSGNSDSASPKVSCNGNYVAFGSGATNLISGITNNTQNIFRYSRMDQSTELISISSSGVQANDISQRPSISDDGRYIAFDSNANNLVSNNTNNFSHIYIRDVKTNTTQFGALDSSGNLENKGSFRAILSADGSNIVYISYSSTLVTSPNNSTYTAQVYKSQTGF